MSQTGVLSTLGVHIKPTMSKNYLSVLRHPPLPGLDRYSLSF
jgi:hypothetical protein